MEKKRTDINNEYVSFHVDASPDLNQNVASPKADVTFQPSSWMTTNCRFRPPDR